MLWGVDTVVKVYHFTLDGDDMKIRSAVELTQEQLEAKLGGQAITNFVEVDSSAVEIGTKEI